MTKGNSSTCVAPLQPVTVRVSAWGPKEGRLGGQLAGKAGGRGGRASKLSSAPAASDAMSIKILSEEKKPAPTTGLGGSGKGGTVGSRSLIGSTRSV
jgi:hypothetical protein